MKITAEMIRCPTYQPYFQHFLVATEELVMGEPFDQWQSRIKDEDPDGYEAMESNENWAEYWEASVAFVLTNTDEVELPPGWTMDGFEFHPHKDANGLVALYFEGNCTRDSCPQKDAA